MEHILRLFNQGYGKMMRQNMGVVFKPKDKKRRKNTDKAFKDLAPSIGDVSKIITENKGEDIEKKLTELKKFKKIRDLTEKK